MTKDEGYLMLCTQVGHPIPAKYALNANDDIIKVRENHFKEQLRIGIDVLVDSDFTLNVDYADIHFAGV